MVILLTVNLEFEFGFGFEFDLLQSILYVVLS